MYLKRKQVFPKTSKCKNSSISTTTSFEDDYNWEMENIADWENRSHGWNSDKTLSSTKDNFNDEWTELQETTGAVSVPPTASGPKRPKVQIFPPKMTPTSGDSTPLRLPSLNEAEPVKVEGMIGFLEGHRLAQFHTKK